MRQDEKKVAKIFYIIGIIPLIWISLLIAPYIDGGLVNIIKNGSLAFSNPFKIIFTGNSLKTVFIFLLIYIFINIFFSVSKE